VLTPPLPARWPPEAPLHLSPSGELLGHGRELLMLLLEMKEIKTI